MVTVVVAGGFDPLHVGHLRHIREAKLLGTSLTAIVGPDEFLIKKKGYIFMSLRDRMEILASIRWVDDVVVAIDMDGTVAETLRELRPQIYAKGGDRVSDVDMPENEIKACQEIGCQIVYGVGKQIRSSSKLVEEALMKLKQDSYLEIMDLDYGK